MKLKMMTIYHGSDVRSTEFTSNPGFAQNAAR